MLKPCHKPHLRSQDICGYLTSSRQWSRRSDWPRTSFIVNGHNSSMEASNSVTNVVHTLASKVLHTLCSQRWIKSLSDVQPVKVFYLAGRILEEKASLLCMIVAQTTAILPTAKDPEEAARHERGLRLRPLRFLTHTPRMVKSQPYFMIRHLPKVQLIFQM